MDPAINAIKQFAVKNGAQLLGVSHEFQAYITDFRSMSKHGNSVEPNLSMYSMKVVLLYCGKAKQQSTGYNQMY